MLSGGPSQRPADLASGVLEQESALRVLQQHPIPVIAVADNGVIVFANSAFADLLHCSCDAVTSLSYRDICSSLPDDETLFAVTRLSPNTVGRLLQLGQATLFVKVRKSAVATAADPNPIAQFEGLLERLSRLADPEVR